MEAKAMQPSPKVRVSAASSRHAAEEHGSGVYSMHPFPQAQPEPHQQDWLQKLTTAHSFFCAEALHLKITECPGDDDDDVMPGVV